MQKTILSILFLAFALTMVGQKQELSVAERNAQMGFNDTIDRLADDFVFVSLMVADPTDWRDDMLGMLGHAFLRLQCPVFGLDYCFSYESENVNTQFSKYAQGKLKMGMFAIPTDEYLQDYWKWNRAVHEYRLNLPPDVETRLWEIMDNKLSRGLSLKLDLSRRGCAISAVHFIKAALQDIPIVYPQGTRYETLSRREIMYQDLEAHPWLRLLYGTVIPNDYDKDCPIDEKLIVPADLAEIWQQSTVKGNVLAEYVGDIVSSDYVAPEPPFITPQRVAWAILLITLLLITLGINGWHWVLLGIQFLVGGFLLYSALFTQQFAGAGWLIEALVLVCWPHMLVDPAYIILLLSYSVLFASEPIKHAYARRKAK